MSVTSIHPSDLNAARQRISTAYDPEILRSAGRDVIDLLADHLTSSESSRGRVLNWNSPQTNIMEALRILKSAGDSATSGEIARQLRSLAEVMLSRGHNLHDPRYIGHQVPASVPLAGLFDAIGSVTNSVMAVYEMGPWATACEMALIELIGEQIGYPPGQFSGLITHGGSLANLTALLTARNVVLGESWQAGILTEGPKPVIVAHQAAHYCIERSAGILGMGTDQCIKAPLDDYGRIDPEQLAELLAKLKSDGHPIVAVCASACATPIGAFDPLHRIADVCERFGTWMHVDAAHGGAACFSSHYRHLVEGLERADSMICDAHKMMFVPALCAFVFYRDREHRYDAFQQNAPYLFDPSAPDITEYDSGLKTVECTKRAAAFGLWGVWSLFGKSFFGDLVDITFSMGRTFFEMLADADDFETLHEPQCNIVAFRYLPEQLKHQRAEDIGKVQLEIRRHLIESGEFYLVPTRHAGTAALRCTIINPLTTPDHLNALLDAIRVEGDRVLASQY